MYHKQKWISNPETGRWILLGGPTYKNLISRGFKLRQRGGGQDEEEENEQKTLNALGVVSGYLEKTNVESYANLRASSKVLANATKDSADRRALAAFQCIRQSYQIMPSLAEIGKLWKVYDDKLDLIVEHASDYLDMQINDEDDQNMKVHMMYLIKFGYIIKKKLLSNTQIDNLVIRINAYCANRIRFITNLNEWLNMLGTYVPCLIHRDIEYYGQLLYCSIKDPVYNNSDLEGQRVVACLNSHKKSKNVQVTNYHALLKLISDSSLTQQNLEFNNKTLQLLSMIYECTALRQDLDQLGFKMGKRFLYFNNESNKVVSLQSVQSEIVSLHFSALLQNFQEIDKIKNKQVPDDVVEAFKDYYDAMIKWYSPGEFDCARLDMDWKDVLEHIQKIATIFRDKALIGSFNTKIMPLNGSDETRSKIEAAWSTLVTAANKASDSPQKALVLDADRYTLGKLKTYWNSDLRV